MKGIDMITRYDPPSQKQTTDIADWATESGPPQDTPDYEPLRCPLCSRAALPFDPRLSGLLDLVDELAQAVRIVKRAAEEASL
jgi:hypothetical protein